MGQPPFEAVIEAHHGEIYRYLRRVSFRPTEAEDLSQETFLRAYRAYRRLGPDANVRAWLFAIATNVFRNHVRGERRRRAAHDAATEHARDVDGGGGALVDGPEAEAMLREARMVLEEVIDGLPLRQRLAFVLRKAHDLGYEDIGRSLECSAETARAHVFQAFRKIRRALDGQPLPAAEPVA
jgi:RNA polymerase sigma factor (sigma-70 family)